jgi:hypothetical protein
MFFGVIGAGFWLAPLGEWRRWMAGRWLLVLPVVIFFLLVPELGALALSLWDRPIIVAATFSSVSALLSLVGGATYADPNTRVIGYDNFYVEIAPSCSGLEGLVLMGSFVGLYGMLFRSDLRFPHYWLIVLPLALTASWCLNVVRVAILIIMGAHFSPEIAVNGFHSYAGWMFFTLTAFGLVYVIHCIPALRGGWGQLDSLPLTHDRHAALILPLAVFLVTGVVGSAVTIDSDLAFPARAIALAVALGAFWKHYRGLQCTPDAVAALVGAMIGLFWVATDPDVHKQGALETALSDLAPTLLVSWIVLRIAGSALLVPIAEELFFRGYLLARLNFGGNVGKAFAIILSSALFALLHERWFAAAAAGVVFAVVFLRKGRLGDAIVAHIVANSVILMPGFLSGEWPSL